MSQESFDSLRKRFRESALERLDELRDAVARLEANRGDRDAMSVVSRHFHAFAGMGATYGFKRVSTLGDEAEELTLTMMSRDGRPTEAELSRFRELIGAVEREVSGRES